MGERGRHTSGRACSSQFLDKLTTFLVINNNLSDFSGKKRAKNPMGAKILLLKRLSKMSSSITYVYDQHLNKGKNTPFRVHHV